MAVYEITPDVWSVGVVDWDVRYFHGPVYSTHRGTSYNSYLIKDKKTVLVDTVYAPFSQELVENIKSLVDPGSLDYVVVNHIEPDHSGALPEIMKLNPQATVICTAKGKEGMEKCFSRDWNYQVVKTGDSIELGKYSLKFLEAPMLHWPDSMFTYMPEQALLMPNDAFGQHMAWSQPFDDQNDIHTVMYEARKYYANILTPFNRLVAKKLEEVEKLGLDIKMIAPSHGVIWRKNVQGIVQSYGRWAAGEAENRAVVVYETMWGSTEKMARAIVEGIISEGVPVRLFKMSLSDRSEIIGELFNSKALIVGSSTMNNEMLGVLTPLLEELRGLKHPGKIGAAFGAHGWRGGATKNIEKYMEESGIKVQAPALEVQWGPEDIQACREWGAEIARKIKS